MTIGKIALPLYFLAFAASSPAQKQYSYETDSLAICALLGKCDSTCFMREECDYIGACPESTQYRCGPLVKLISNARNGRVTSLFIKDLLSKLPHDTLLYRLKNLIYLTELETLSIYGNYMMEDFPIEICSLYNLRALDLGGNNIDSIPPCIGNLENLQILVLIMNKLASLPAEIGHLKNLKQISLRSNSLKIFPFSLCSLATLQYVNVSFNQIQQLPAEIGNLNGCAIFDASFNQLTSVPPSIGSLENCAILYLDSNQLVTLPPEIGNLRSIQRLYLYDNDLSTLPESIIQLDSLLLVISNNRLCNVSHNVAEWLDKYAGADWRQSQRCSSSTITKSFSTSVVLNKGFVFYDGVFTLTGKKIHRQLELNQMQYNSNTPFLVITSKKKSCMVLFIGRNYYSTKSNLWGGAGKNKIRNAQPETSPNK